MTRKTVAHPCALVQPDLTRAVDTMTVTQAEAWVMQSLAAHITADPRTEPDWFCRQAASLAGRVPGRLAEEIRRFADVGSSTGIFVVRGLMTGNIPATPLNNKSAIGSTTLLAKQEAILSELLGSMVAYQAEGHGYLLQDMVPNPELAWTQESQGFKTELEAHTEQAFSSLRPDYVVLGCLRGDNEAATYVFDSINMTAHFTDAEVSMMREARWTTTIDGSFKPFVPNPAEIRGPWPILSGPGWDPTMVIDQDLMTGIDSVAQALLDKMIATYNTKRNQHTLKPGEILFLDNVRAMHGRSPFNPKLDGADRFIVRGFITRDRRKLLEYMGPDRRTILARFS